jgi:hypothetical protein
MQSFKEHLHEGSRRKRFRVDYIYQTKSGAPCRTQVMSSNVQLPSLATSETAVLSWLKKRHTGAEITIINLDWFDN